MKKIQVFKKSYYKFQGESNNLGVFILILTLGFNRF